MTHKVLAACTVLVALLASHAASAQSQTPGQSDSPQWLKDRKFSEGIGIRSGDLELHPGLAGEVGYDSNWLLRSDRQVCGAGLQCQNGPPVAPVVPAAEFRITPSLTLSTLSGPRRAGDSGDVAPTVAFRAGINATYRAFVGLGNDSSGINDISQQNTLKNTSVGADVRLDVLPGRPVGGSLFVNYSRVPQPDVTNVDPDLAFNSDNVGGGVDLAFQPGGGTLDWHVGYQANGVLFEETDGQPFSNVTNEVVTRGRWRFRPRTALIYDANFRFVSYTNSVLAQTQGLDNSTPLRARIGLNGLVTDLFALLALVGWGASFFDTSQFAQQPQYDSVIGQAELKWFLAASPGVAAALSDVSLSLSSIAVGYSRDFQNSYLGDYSGRDRGYLRFSYLFAGKVLLTLEGGVGAVEYPNLYWLSPVQLRHASFTDIRADATLFGEYRLGEAFGINATIRYTSNISNVHDMPDQEGSPALFDMSWNRLEAFLGVRWFL